MKVKINLRQKLVYRVWIYSAVFLCVFVGGFAYFNFVKVHTAKGDSVNTPYLAFHDPVLISGTDLQLGAIYLFANAGTNIDVQIEISALSGGATLANIDHFTAGYNDAWQPNVVAPPNTSSFIEWEIMFKVAGTNTDTIIDLLTSTAVDVDGNGVSLQEFVQTGTRRGYSRSIGCNLQIIWDGLLVKATSPVDNVANIDTSQRQAMFQMNYSNIKSITYRTGAISTHGGDQIRQNCIMFRSFFDDNIPLPIQLLKFTGKKVDDKQVKLQWITATEQNNDYFTIERSNDRQHFNQIAKINGAGNSNHQINYEYVDLNPEKGSNYYRLRQTDFDGKSETFNPILVKMNESVLDLVIHSAYPNPFKDKVTISYDCPYECEINFLLLNTQGQILVNQSTNAKAGRNSFDFNIQPEINSGNYFIVLNGKEFKSKTIKVIKE